MVNWQSQEEVIKDGGMCFPGSCPLSLPDALIVAFGRFMHALLGLYMLVASPGFVCLVPSDICVAGNGLLPSTLTGNSSRARKNFAGQWWVNSQAGQAAHQIINLPPDLLLSESLRFTRCSHRHVSPHLTCSFLSADFGSVLWPLM